MPSPSHHPRDPLHGVKLETIVNLLVAKYGWAEMGERIHALASQIEASAAEKLQREAENQQLKQQAADLEAERNAGQAREADVR